MAYVLGFMFADASVDKKSNKIHVAVKQSDKEILEQIVVAMHSNYPVSVFGRNHGFEGERLAHLQIYSATLKSDLMSLGVIPNKTYSMAFPVVPDGYLRDFVRGYFDGDGSVSHYTQRDKPGFVGIRTFFICHEKNFLVILGDLIRDHIGNIPKIYPLENSWRLQYGAQESVSLYDWMYLNPAASMYLPRKRLRFEDWLDIKGIRHNYKRVCKKCRKPFVKISGLADICKSCKKAKI